MAAESEPTASGESRGTRAVSEADGESLAAARHAVIKDLEPRFPGVTAECVEFEVLDEAANRVRGTVDLDAWTEAAEADLPDQPEQRLRLVVTRVVQELGLRGDVEVEADADELRATVEGDDLGLLIGKHGQTIDALSQIAQRIALGGAEERKRVVVDAAGYRAKREAALQRSADQAVAEALRQGRAVELEPMRANERRVVHEYLRDRTEIETHSEGDEPDRRLVISPAGALDS